MAATPSTGAPPARSGISWPLPRRTDAFTPPLDGLDNERGQAYVRFAICCFMALYFYLIGFSNHLLYLGFSVYCLAYLAILRRARTASTARIVLALLLDNYFTVGGLYVTGSKGVFLYIFLIHISFGYGVRYGRAYLWMSVSAACVGVVTLYLASPHWRGNVHAMIAYLFGVPFIALYIDYFVQRLRRAQREADARTTEVTRLLAFVAHDIRTPLQSLLSTIEMTRAGSLEQGTRMRLGRMEQAVQVLARMATEVLGTARTPPAAQAAPAVATFAWLVSVVNIFRDEFARQHIGLRYQFDFTVPPLVHLDRLAAERLLLNALSNAARHAMGGEIRLQVTSHDGPGSERHLVFTLANRAAGGHGDASTDRMHEGSTFHGAGLGLAGARETAANAHAEFRYETVDGDTHQLQFSMPIRPAADSGPAIMLPVIVVSATRVAPAPLFAALGDVARCIAFSSIDDLLLHAAALKPRIAAVFITEEALGPLADEQAVTTLCESLGPCTILVGASMQTASGSTGVVGRFERDAPPQAYINAVYAQSAMRDIACGIAPPDYSWRNRLAHRRILLVEDNAINADMLAEGLRDFTTGIRIASSIAGARDLLANETFDIVLLDWHLADGCTVALADELARHWRESRTRTIVLSAESAATIRQALASRLDCPIVQRPATLTHIVDTIVQALHDRPTGPSTHEICGSAVFAADIFDEMRGGVPGAARIDALLGRAVRDIDAVFARVADILATSEQTRLRHTLHDLKSIADAVGAHELGRGAQILIDGAASAGQLGEVMTPAALAPLHALWRLTEDHMTVYRLSLSELRSSVPPSAA